MVEKSNGLHNNRLGYYTFLSFWFPLHAHAHAHNFSSKSTSKNKSDFCVRDEERNVATTSENVYVANRRRTSVVEVVSHFTNSKCLIICSMYIDYYRNERLAHAKGMKNWMAA